MNVVFLYTRLPGYFLSCLKHLVEKYPSVVVHCVVYKPAQEAPYEHTLPERIHIRNKNSITDLPAFVKELDPSIIYVTGWSDADYKRTANAFADKIPVLLGLDNPWKGNIRQLAATFAARSSLKRSFNYAWVPGVRQYEFARRLGFLPQRILQGLYCADMTNLQSLENNYSNQTILFAGRMVDYKHPDWLVETFCEFQKQGKYSDWRLVMLGSGPMKTQLEQMAKNNSKVEFIEFVQPNEIPAYYSQSTLFCLPSTHEHWGVVVHEAAAAGLPLLLSDTCGAADAFLISGGNGQTFKTGNKEHFVQQLGNLLGQSTQSLKQMGQMSRTLSARIDHNIWTDTFMSVLQ